MVEGHEGHMTSFQQQGVGQQNIWRQQVLGGDGRVLEHQDVGGSRELNGNVRS